MHPRPIDSTRENPAGHSEIEVYFPDGGIRAWLTVLGGFLAFVATLGFLTGGSVFQSYYASTAFPNENPSTISWIGSVQVWGCYFFGLWSGRLSDRYGPTLPLSVGTFLMVFGNMMSSLATEFYQVLLSQGFCLSIGMGLAFTPTLAVQSQWFLRRRGFVVAAVMSGQNLTYIMLLLTGVIWPVLTNKLLNEKGFSLHWTLRIIAFMQLVLMVAATLLIQPRFARSRERELLPLRRYFTDKRTVLFTFALLIMNLGIYIPWFFITPYAMQWGTSPSLSFYDAAILNAGGFFGCYALGLIADSGFGFLNALPLTCVACGVVGFAWISATSVPGIIVWALAYGLLSGAIQAIFSPCLSLLAPSPEVLGSWNGICITINSFAVLGTGPIAGRLLENTGGTNYLPMQVFTGVTTFTAGVLFGATRFLDFP
ncbi:major facilitator superfamily domain-containing protein [Aspergillus tamarii]|uniref:Major facilitator superfamily domain-containing protein n=1 Tax=Aspergillus tamarii TaxID=41984 RepID=A0A5N6UZA8_ASPTM|nr:major facilitator superfamily domain-containing protein [Aspergillus tamarii]